MFKNYLTKMKGWKTIPPRKPLTEIAWSWLGAFIGIYLIVQIGHFSHINSLDHMFLVGSFGASAVLIYGAPQVEYSQPRNLIGGHIISALIGVSLYKLLPLDIPLLGALVVACAIAAMHLTRTVHPPGGATGLIAVIGSDQVHALGYQYVFMPVAVGCFIMLLVAVLVNNLSNNPARRYPTFWF